MELEKESLNDDKETDCVLQKKSPLNLDNCVTNWKSETKDSFPAKENYQEKIGKRKKLLKKYFELQAGKEIQEEEYGKEPLPVSNFTEYIESFCKSDFKPIIENDNCDISMQLKYPLYGGVANSLYKEQVEKGYLKAHSSICTYNHPFRKSNSFTMPPELSLRKVDS